jgi:hypothetical protein
MRRFNRDIVLLVLVTLLAAGLRFWHLGRLPLWVDEAYLAELVRGFTPARQEWPYVLLCRALGTAVPLDEFWLRFPSALFGTLTVPAFYWAMRGRSGAAAATLLIAVFPIFVFYSRLARPYALAGFCVVLGWRFWPMYLVAMLTTPIALLGIDFAALRRRRALPQVIALVGLAVVLFLLRPDRGRGADFLNWRFLLDAKRLWYIPALGILLHLVRYGLAAGRSRHPGGKKRLV